MGDGQGQSTSGTDDCADNARQESSPVNGVTRGVGQNLDVLNQFSFHLGLPPVD